MKIIRVPHANGIFTVIESGDVEYVNPVEHFRQATIASCLAFDQNVLMLKGTQYPLTFYDSILKQRAEEFWQEEYQDLVSTTIPSKLLELVDSKSKKEQESILRGLVLKNTEFHAFILAIGEKYGFTFSQYTGMHYPKGVNREKFPRVFHKKDDGTMSIIGETTLTDGQLKQAVEQRNVTVVKFFDKGPVWHCFFLTFKSLGGKENYKDGQPHLHYISNFWGLTRKAVLKELLSKNYSLPSLPHIDFHTHRNPYK